MNDADTPLRGRPRDPARDTALLTTTAQLLAERGYTGFTVADVARQARASKATVYRRWPHKADLVVAALLHAANTDDRAPDTGTLRGDLFALVGQIAAATADLGHLFNLVVGQLQHDAELATAFRTGILRRRSDAVATVFDRARQRGEIPAERNSALLRDLIPALIFYRLAVLGELPEPQLIAELIDHVVLPLALRPATTSG